MVRKVARPDPTKARTLRVGVLGPQTARCESCTADCSATIGEWAITGLCVKCSQQKGAGR